MTTISSRRPSHTRHSAPSVNVSKERAADDSPLADVLTHPLANYYLVLVSALLLVAVGLMMVLSSSSAYAQASGYSSYYYLQKQLVFLAVGIPMAAVVSRSHAAVTDPADVAAAVEIAATDAPLRVVVNCAGIAPPAKVLDRDGIPTPLSHFEKVVRINLVGTYNVAAQAAAVMARNDPAGGVIVNTASVAAFDGQIGQPGYSASKGGVHAMTLPIARELARYGIRVVTIAPGIMETPMLAGLPQAAQDSLGQQVPYPARLGSPDEYARLVLAIVDNDYLNGETIRLDGAIRMAPR